MPSSNDEFVAVSMQSIMWPGATCPRDRFAAVRRAASNTPLSNGRAEAEGCAESPVPTVEGWFVETAWRGRGVGRALIEAAEAWARERGHREIASDAEVDNRGSRAAHRALGFEELPAIVPMRRRLG